MNKLSNKAWLVLVILLVGLPYVLLNENFNIYYEDDSWTISNVWNAYQLNIEEDLIFLEADASGRLHYFSKIYNLICGGFLSLLGWTKANVFIFNSILIGLATIVWWFILKNLPISNKVAKVVVLLMPIFPPFFFAAHTGRPDAMTFLLVSLGFLSFIKRHYILATFLVIMAAETHIMGLVGAFYILAYVLYKRRDYYDTPRELGQIIMQSTLGLLLGVAYYLSLHWQTFSINDLLVLIHSKSDMVSPLNNYILTYFTDFDWHNHLIEFGLLVFSTFLFIKNKFYKENEFISLFLIVLLFSTLITRRENRNYIIYVFPAILLMYAYTYERLKKLPQFLTAVFIMLSLYYGSTFYANRGYNFQVISDTIDEVNEKEALPIVGMPDIWFAAKEKTFYPIHTHRDFNRIALSTFYLVETDFLAHRNRAYQPLVDYLFANYERELVRKSIVYQDKTLRIWKLSNANKPLPKYIKKDYPGWQKVVKRYLLAESNL